MTTTTTGTAQCPMQHEWPVSWQVVYGGMRRREGKRPQRVITWVVEPAPTCPTCGHKWARLFPLDGESRKC
jgi:hypothetical protein